MPLFGANKSFFLKTPWQRSFVVALFFVTIAALLFWLDTFRMYQSEVRIFVMSRSSNVTTDEAVANFSELSKNLSFYERVLQGNDLLDDDFAGYSKDERKALWNEAVSVTQSDKSGVLTVTARKATPDQAKLLSEGTVKTLFAMAGFYYDIKKDIDLRVVDEPIVSPVLVHPIRYVLASFGSALVVTSFFFWFLFLVPSLFGRRRANIPTHSPQPVLSPKAEKEPHHFSIGEAVPFIDPRKFIPTRPASLSFGMSHEEEAIRQEILSSVSKAPAPVNLPVAASSDVLLPGMETDMTELPFRFEDESEEKEPVVMSSEPAVETPAPAEIKRGEPSVDEYKRRLNELLAGGR